MAKKHERSELESLRAVIKSQRSQIKNLKKELGRNRKRAHQYNDLEEKLSELEVDEELVEETKVERCPNCQGEIKVTSLGARTLRSCSCGYRKSKKSVCS